MNVVVLTVICALLIGGVLWLVIGSRFKLDEDTDQNDRINFVLYCLGAVPVGFVLIFFGLG